MLKRLIFTFSVLIGSIGILYAAPEYQNTLLLKVLDTTGFPGFIGTCSDEIHQGGKTVCSIPQKIEKGQQSIYVPPYPNSYPVFSTDGDNYFTCATLDEPTAQLFFSPQNIQENTLVLESFILDKDKNKIAVLCGLQPNQ